MVSHHFLHQFSRFQLFDFSHLHPSEKSPYENLKAKKTFIYVDITSQLSTNIEKIRHHFKQKLTICNHAVQQHICQPQSDNNMRNKDVISGIKPQKRLIKIKSPASNLTSQKIAILKSK